MSKRSREDIDSGDEVLAKRMRSVTVSSGQGAAQEGGGGQAAASAPRSHSPSMYSEINGLLKALHLEKLSRMTATQRRDVVGV